MFVNKLFTYISHAHVSKRKKCLNVKSSIYYFHVKTMILADFQICISAPLKSEEPSEKLCQHQSSITLKDNDRNF